MNIQNELAHSTPEAQGVSSLALYAFIEAIEANQLELHSWMLLRHGVVVAEGWWSPYRAEHPHLLNSVSKSFTSTAIGLAVAEGRLSIDDTVMSFFPSSAPDDMNENLPALRIKHLLSMSTGHAEDTISVLLSRTDGDWIRAFLGVPIRYTPGTHFIYNSGATYMLSAILQKITGMSLLDYLQPRLLTPLGIANANWDTSPQGIQMGGWGLSITTEAIARFGQLYLQKGLWNGQQIVPTAWIEEATAYQVSTVSNTSSDWQQGYGYQFWRCQDGAYRGDGAFGQYCIVMPDQEAVLAITGSVYDMQAVLNLVWKHIKPGIQAAPPLPEQPEAAHQLTHKLDSLHIDPPIGEAITSIAQVVSGKLYMLEVNSLALESIRLDFSASDCNITLRETTEKYHEHHLVCGILAWQQGTLTLFGDYSRLVASGAWIQDDTFEMTLRFYETSAVYIIRFYFVENNLTVTITAEYVLNGRAYHLRGVAPATK